MSECPTCGEEFKNEFGVKLHHQQKHDESIAGVKVDCVNCGEEFNVPPCRGDEAKFCSMECRDEYQINTGTFAGKNNGAYNSEVLKCDNCAEDIEVPKSHITDLNFCSNSCHWEYVKENELLVGENNPSWEGGAPDYYGESWPSQRRKALEEADYNCQMCGKTKKEMGQNPDVHHRKPFREYGVENHKEANRLDNLICLCRSCHSTWERISIQPEVPA